LNVSSTLAAANHLDRDESVQAALSRLVHDAHAALAKHLENLICGKVRVTGPRCAGGVSGGIITIGDLCGIGGLLAAPRLPRRDEKPGSLLVEGVVGVKPKPQLVATVLSCTRVDSRLAGFRGTSIVFP
jgi:hypothetical protein